MEQSIGKQGERGRVVDGAVHWKTGKAGVILYPILPASFLMTGKFPVVGSEVCEVCEDLG